MKCLAWLSGTAVAMGVLAGAACGGSVTHGFTPDGGMDAGEGSRPFTDRATGAVRPNTPRRAVERLPAAGARPPRAHRAS